MSVLTFGDALKRLGLGEDAEGSVWDWVSYESVLVTPEHASEKIAMCRRDKHGNAEYFARCWEIVLVEVLRRDAKNAGITDALTEGWL